MRRWAIGSTLSSNSSKVTAPKSPREASGAMRHRVGRIEHSSDIVMMVTAHSASGPLANSGKLGAKGDASSG